MRKREPKMIDGIEHWQCSTCENYFTRDYFYQEKRNSSGLKSECKKCHQLTCLATRNIENHRDKNRDWMRKSNYGKRPDVMERHLLISRVKNKTIEAKARALANRVVQLGFLTRPKLCSNCGRGDLKIHAHHDDPMKPLDVKWLCSECHGRIRRLASDIWV